MQFSVSPPPSGHCVRQPRWGRQSISAASQPASARQSSAGSPRLSSPIGLETRDLELGTTSSPQSVNSPPATCQKILPHYYFRNIKVHKNRVRRPKWKRLVVTWKKTCYVLCTRKESETCHMSRSSQRPDNTLEIPSPPQLSGSTVKIEKSQ